jgi:hypothetical protein
MKELMEKFWRTPTGVHCRWFWHFGPTSLTSKDPRSIGDLQNIVERRLEEAALNVHHAEECKKTLENKLEIIFQNNKSHDHQPYSNAGQTNSQVDRLKRRIGKQQEKIDARLNYYHRKWSVCHDVEILNPAWGDREQFLLTHSIGRRVSRIMLPKPQ